MRKETAQAIQAPPDTGEKIGLREQFSFFIVNVGNIPIMTLASSFLLIFYTDVVGLKAASIGTLFLIARVLDGFNDPVTGFVVDRFFPKTKMGRFRPYLMLGALFCSLNYLVLWLGPLWSPAGKMVIAYISYLLLGVTFDLMDIPLNSMIAVMTDVPKERNRLSLVKTLGYAGGAGLVMLPVPIILERVRDNPDLTAMAYTILIIAASAITLVFSVVGAAGIRERIQPPKDEDTTYSLREMFSVITEKPVRTVFLAQLLSSAGGAAGGAVTIYYAKYILGSESIMVVLGLVGVVGGLPMLLLLPKLVERFGKRTLFAVGYIIPAIANLLKLFAYRNIPWLVICSILSGFGGAFTMPMSYGIQADNIDYIDYKRGQRAEGIIASMNSFVLKASGGIGGALAAYVLAWTGYIPNAEQQPLSAERGILLNAILLPAIMALIAGLLFRFQYDITEERMAEITQELRERRAAAGKEEEADV